MNTVRQEDIIDDFDWDIFGNITLSESNFFNLSNLTENSNNFGIFSWRFDNFGDIAFLLQLNISITSKIDPDFFTNHVSLFGLFILPSSVDHGNNEDIDDPIDVLLTENMTDVTIDIQDIVSFPENDTSVIIFRYDVTLYCEHIRFDQIITGNISVGFAIETTYEDPVPCDESVVWLVGNSTFFSLSGEHLEDSSIYNITIYVGDTFFTYLELIIEHVSIYVPDSTALYVIIEIFGNPRFNKDSRVVLTVDVKNDGVNAEDVQYIWYEASGKLDISNLDFITTYQNYLAIDASKDYDGVLKENANYTFQLFALSELSQFRLGYTFFRSFF